MIVSAGVITTLVLVAVLVVFFTLMIWREIASKKRMEIMQRVTPAFGEYVYTQACVTLNRWTGAIALVLAAVTVVVGPFVAIGIGLNDNPNAGWGCFFSAMVFGAALAAVGLSAYVIAELLTLAVRAGNSLDTISLLLKDARVTAGGPEGEQSPPQRST